MYANIRDVISIRLEFWNTDLHLTGHIICRAGVRRDGGFAIDHMISGTRNISGDHKGRPYKIIATHSMKPCTRSGSNSTCYAIYGVREHVPRGSPRGGNANLQGRIPRATPFMAFASAYRVIYRAGGTPTCAGIGR